MLDIIQIHEPRSVGEASALLEEYGFEAAVYAGGTELLLVMKEGLAHYPHLVNIKTLPGLDDISFDSKQGELHIGSLVTHRQLERSSIIHQYAPLLAEVAAMIGNVRVRAMGTIGGNLCFAEPHSDPAALLLAWEGILELSSAEAQRRVPVADFFLGIFETARRPGEILTGIRLPLLPGNAAGAYQKFSTHERPTATVAALLRLEAGVIEEARLVVGSVGPIPLHLPEAEERLCGERPNKALFIAAAKTASRAVDPVDDLYGSTDYKRHLVRILTIQALELAAARARENDHDP